MHTFLIWLTNLRENTSTDPSSYDQVFQQQLDAIKDKLPTETYQKLKDLNWGNYIASQLRKANFHADIDDHLQHIAPTFSSNLAICSEAGTRNFTGHWIAALVPA